MIKKILLSLACIGIIIGLSVAATSSYVVLKVAQEIDKAERKYSGPQVLGLPDGYNPTKPIETYTGPHPANITRPDDPFNYPIKIGQIGPIMPLMRRGELEYPFLCRIEKSLLGQPIIDNQEGAGMAVFRENENGELTREIVGYSKDCLFKTNAWYYYNRKGTSKFYALEDFREGHEIEKITINGITTDFIVRVEMGTINRFLYMVATIKSPDGTIEQPSNTLWNEKLIYNFRGGVGVGKRQGRINPRSILRDNYLELKQGYGVAYSSANQTSMHYNIWLAEDTVARVKRQFSALYGTPMHTIGVGGSGGAIQQYLIAQNNPDLLDAAIAVYSYPDMVTQTIYALDCDLMEYYFDVTAKNISFWKNWNNRRLVEGLNSLTNESNPMGQLHSVISLMKGEIPNLSYGASECAKGWRGPAQVIHNPKFAHFSPRYTETLRTKVNWTHWDNLKQFYGTNKNGIAKTTWDNIGVQYGLDALRKGKIDIEKFIHLNQHIGGWKQQDQMDQPRLWYFSGNSSFKDISLWSHHNMNLTNGNESVAPRTAGDVDAIKAAYLSGHVFLGKANIPIIDLRHYLDSELDMHHSFATFSTRKRMIEFSGHADNQIIWMTQKPHRPINNAVIALDKWLVNIKQQPDKSVADNRPLEVEHTCFDSEENVIAKGPSVWDGQWNGRATGRCMQLYPSHASSRIIAGGKINDDVFKCALQPVEDAVANGTYGIIDVTPHINSLKKLFPNGVCDYQKPDQGRPKDILLQNTASAIASQ